MAMDAVLATIVASGWTILENTQRSINFINNYFNLLILPKPFDRGLGRNMSKAARHSDGVDSSNPCRWRGKQLHHHGGGVCWLFVLLWIDSWRHKPNKCKKWYKNNPKEGLCGVTFWPTLACTTPEGTSIGFIDQEGDLLLLHQTDISGICSWHRRVCKKKKGTVLSWCGPVD